MNAVVTRHTKDSRSASKSRNHLHQDARSNSKEVAGDGSAAWLLDVKPLPKGHVSLLKLLAERLERTWLEDEPLLLDGSGTATYDTRIYLKRRAPNEIETVLATIDQLGLDMIEQGFTDSSFGIYQFCQAIVHGGTYDSDHVLAFIGGVVDLFLEVLWSQANRSDGAPPSTVRWGQLMNHFIESPEIAMYESSEGGMAIALNAQGGSGHKNEPQMRKSSIADVAKHYGHSIDKVYWFPYLDTMATCEGTESLMLWTPSSGWDSARLLTPQLPDSFFTEAGDALWTVLAVAWDTEMQDIVALLSNRVLVQWRLRNREKGQFQQKRELRVCADKTNVFGQGDSSVGGIKGLGDAWKVKLKFVETAEGIPTNHGQNGTNSSMALSRKKLLSESRGHLIDAREEIRMKNGLRDQLEAEEVAAQLNIWWNSTLKLYVTTDKRGRLYFWDLRRFDAVVTEKTFPATHELKKHTEAVTGHLEIGKTKFVTASLDRTVILWDNKNMTVEMRITDHTSCVLCQAYLPLFSSLVSVGCEKKVFVWTIDAQAYRGTRARLSAHKSNLLSVAAGQRVFLTLDEGSVSMLWDAATLTCLQSVKAIDPAVHAMCLPSVGRMCLVGHRINFYEGNETLQNLLGMLPTPEQVERRKQQAELLGGTKARALPRYCGLNARRGCVLSATEMEVMLHARGDPTKARILFNAPEGDTISCFVPMDDLSLVVLGTAKGGIHVLKYRSGFLLKAYPGRQSEDVKQTQSRAAPASGPESESRQCSPSNQPRQRTPANSASRTSSPVASVSHPVSPATTTPHRVSMSMFSPAGGGVLRERPDSPDGGGDRGSTRWARQASSSGSGDGSVAGAAAAARRQQPAPTQNAPTADDIATGLSSNITCILPCEERRRIFVGTGEGRVLVIDCDGDFPIVRWFSTEDTGAVTCLHCSTSGEGILAVGTNDGAAHLYNLSSFRLAGSINIPRLLRDFDTSGRNVLRHIRLLDVDGSSPQLPCTLLTIDGLSRMRYWGLQIPVHSQKMSDLALLFDAGQLRPLEDSGRSDEAVKQQLAASEDLKPDDLTGRTSVSKAPDVGDVEADSDDDDGFSSRNSVAESPGGEDEPSSVCINVVTIFRGRDFLSIPTFKKLQWLEDWRSRPEPPPPQPPAQSAQPQRLPSNDKGQRAGKKTKKQKSQRFDVVEVAENMEGYETEGDDDTCVASRYAQRPRTPPLRGEAVPGTVGAPQVSGTAAASSNKLPSATANKKEAEVPELPPLPPEPEPVEAMANRIMFLADGKGYIWCVDVAETVKAGSEACLPTIAVLDSLLRRQPPPSRRSKRVTLVASGLGIDEIGQPYLAGPPPAAVPGAVKVLGAWKAHSRSISSLVAVGTPAALVSTDDSKDVKLWSTSGELWAHFTLNGPDGQVPASIIWPPPHSLAAQLALMSIGKGLARRLGLSDRGHGTGGQAEKLGRGGRRSLSRQMSRRNSSSERSMGMSIGQRGGSKGGGWHKNQLGESVGVDAGSTPLPDTQGDTRATAASSKSLPGISSASRGAAEDICESASPVGADEDASPITPDDSHQPRKDRLTPGQLSEMLRTHAFSAGFQSYKKFQRSGQATASRSGTSGVANAKALEVERASFFSRPPDAFGVALRTDAEEKSWEQAAYALPQRSSSEGALLRYAQNTADEMAWAVKTQLGIDVSKTKRREIRRRDFVSKLDVGGVSLDPLDPTTATGQAVKRIHGNRGRSKDAGAASLGNFNKELRGASKSEIVRLKSKK